MAVTSVATANRFSKEASLIVPSASQPHQRCSRFVHVLAIWLEQSVARCGLRVTMGHAPGPAPGRPIKAATPAWCGTRPSALDRDRLPAPMVDRRASRQRRVDMAYLVDGRQLPRRPPSQNRVHDRRSASARRQIASPAPRGLIRRHERGQRDREDFAATTLAAAQSPANRCPTGLWDVS